MKQWAELGLSSVALVMVGCAVGPEYRRPEGTAPEQFAQATGGGHRDGQPGIPWWQGFQDRRLNQLIARVSTNNLDLKRATARLHEARALWTEARFDYIPTVRADAAYEKSQTSKDFTGFRDRNTELYQAGFDATWELDLWGRVRREVEAARATVETVEATRDDLRVTLQAELAANYFELRGMQAALEVSTRNATNQARTLDLAVALRDGGQGTQLDVARAKALLNETLASVPRRQALIQRAIHRISVLCGLPPATLSDDLAVPVGLPKLPEEVELARPTELLRSRPDVRAAERALAAAHARMRGEMANLFPTVTLNGSVRLEAASFSGMTSPGGDTYQFGPRLTWAAFDLGRVRQRIKAADARAQGALAVYEQTVLLALEEAENSLVTLSRERERLAYLVEAERAASEAVNLARQRYGDGVADYLSVLDAERTLLNLQDQVVGTQTSVATRLVAVYKAFVSGLGFEAKDAHGEPVPESLRASSPKD